MENTKLDKFKKKANRHVNALYLLIESSLIDTNETEVYNSLTKCLNEFYLAVHNVINEDLE